jgi:hypothetical protein
VGVRRHTTRDIHHISETALDTYTRFTETIDNQVADMHSLRKRIQAIAICLLDKHLS